MKNQLKTSQGFSLIELLLVLAIIAALAVAAFVIYPRVQAGRAATYEAQVLSSAQASVKALFTNNDYRALTTLVARQGKFFPSNMESATAGELRNQFDGAVLLAPTGIDPATGGAATPPVGAPSRFFAITYDDVPSEVCIKLAGSAVQNFNGVILTPEGGSASIVKNAADGTLNEALIVTGCGDTTAIMQFISN